MCINRAVVCIGLLSGRLHCRLIGIVVLLVDYQMQMSAHFLQEDRGR